MAASRVRMMGASSAPFWFSAFFLALMPTSIGYQDLAALLAQQPGVSQRWRDHLIASPFGTIEPATFSYGRPIGTDRSRSVIRPSISIRARSPPTPGRSMRRSMRRAPSAVEYPTVNRRLKGDRLPVLNARRRRPEALPQLQPINAPPAAAPLQPRPPANSFILPLKSTEADRQRAAAGAAGAIAAVGAGAATFRHRRAERFAARDGTGRAR